MRMNIKEVTDEKFHIVYCPDQGKPLVCHETYQEAKTEAIRLANKHQGLKFYVLKGESVAQKVEVEVRRLKGSMDHEELF